MSNMANASQPGALSPFAVITSDGTSRQLQMSKMSSTLRNLKWKAASNGISRRDAIRCWLCPAMEYARAFFLFANVMEMSANILFLCCWRQVLCLKMCLSQLSKVSRTETVRGLSTVILIFVRENEDKKFLIWNQIHLQIVLRHFLQSSYSGNEIYKEFYKNNCIWNTFNVSAVSYLQVPASSTDYKICDVEVIIGAA